MPGWPFTTPRVWDYDSGFTAVPAVLTALTTATVYIGGYHFTNGTAAALTITLTDTAGGTILDEQIIPAQGTLSNTDMNFMPVTGLKWNGSGVGITGKIWGWQ